MIKSELKNAEKELLNEAILNFKKSKKGGFAILKLVKSDIQKMQENGKKVKDQNILLNKALGVVIPYTTYRSFYYIYIHKSCKKPTKKNNAKKDIFADLKK